MTWRDVVIGVLTPPVRAVCWTAGYLRGRLPPYPDGAYCHVEPASSIPPRVDLDQLGGDSRADAIACPSRPAGCHCHAGCELPCWLRIGLTATPCCVACAPLPDPDGRKDTPHAPYPR